MNKESKIKEIWTSYLDKSFSITIPLVAILLAFLVSGILMLVWGANPLEAYQALFAGAFGSPNAFATTLERTTPLIFTGLAVTLGYRCGFFNVGAEGQLYMGAIAAIWVGIMLPNLSGWILIPLCVIASAFMGMVWIAIPAVLKAKRGINEVLTTLLMNYIAIQYVEWAIRVDHFKENVLDYYGRCKIGDFSIFYRVDGTLPNPTQDPATDRKYFMPSLKMLMELPFVQSCSGTWHGTRNSSNFRQSGRMSLTRCWVCSRRVLLLPAFSALSQGTKAQGVGIKPGGGKIHGGQCLELTLLITALISGALGWFCGRDGDPRNAAPRDPETSW